MNFDVYGVGKAAGRHLSDESYRVEEDLLSQVGPPKKRVQFLLARVLGKKPPDLDMQHWVNPGGIRSRLRSGRLRLVMPFPLFLLLLVLTGRNSMMAADDSATKNAQLLDRGQQISSVVSTVTSTAVSPLLGVCVLGALQYFRTPAAGRGSLPSYASPKFWIPLCVLLLLILLKDTLGGFAPLIKKPLDAVEVLLLNKAALLLVAVPAVIDQVTRVFGSASILHGISLFGSLAQPVAYAAQTSGAQTAGVSESIVPFVAIVLGLTVTVAVWLAGHALDVLGLLSPFPFVDLLFKCLRSAVLLAVVVTTAFDWRDGAIVSLVIIIFCLIVFRWTFRLALLGSVFAWDLLRLVSGQKGATPRSGDTIWAFATSQVRVVPNRSLGRLALQPGGDLEFRHRFFGLRQLWPAHLENACRYEVGRGLLSPDIISAESGDAKYRVLFKLPPRYLGAEEAVRVSLGLAAVRDIRLPKGLRTAWRMWARPVS